MTLILLNSMIIKDINKNSGIKDLHIFSEKYKDALSRLEL